jgi:hypothetical protein
MRLINCYMTGSASALNVAANDAAGAAWLAGRKPTVDDLPEWVLTEFRIKRVDVLMTAFGVIDLHSNPTSWSDGSVPESYACAA